MTEEQARELRAKTENELRRAGMDGARASDVAQRIAKHVDDKTSGRPIPERFRPIQDTRRRR